MKKYNKGDMKRLNHAHYIKNRGDFIVKCCQYADKNSDWMEFGVADGYSAKICEVILIIIDWHYLIVLKGCLKSGILVKGKWGKINKGYFKCDKPRFKDKKVVIVEGLFENTIADYICNNRRNVSLVHVDCDI